MENIEKRIEELEEKFAHKIEKLRNEFNEVPEFEVGDWVQRTKHLDGPFYSGKIFKIGNIDTKGAKESGDEWIHSLSSLRLATREEIQAHLSKICCKKYLGKKVRELTYPKKVYEVDSDTHWTKYECNNGMDQYWMVDKDDVGICVYQDGVFAKIIEETKALPKIVEEFKNLLIEFDTYSRRKGNTIQFKVNGFLEEKGL